MITDTVSYKKKMITDTISGLGGPGFESHAWTVSIRFGYESNCIEPNYFYNNIISHQ